MGTVWNSNTGKSNANNLSAPTDMTENPHGKKNFFSTMQLKNRPRWYHTELQTKWYQRRGRFLKNVLIFEKKGRVLTKIWHIRNRLSRTVHVEGSRICNERMKQRKGELMANILQPYIVLLSPPPGWFTASTKPRRPAASFRPSLRRTRTRNLRARKGPPPRQGHELRGHVPTRGGLQNY
jgi:hypothetical protein